MSRKIKRERVMPWERETSGRFVTKKKHTVLEKLTPGIYIHFEEKDGGRVLGMFRKETYRESMLDKPNGVMKNPVVSIWVYLKAKGLRFKHEILKGTERTKFLASIAKRKRSFERQRVNGKVDGGTLNAMVVKIDTGKAKMMPAPKQKKSA